MNFNFKKLPPFKFFVLQNFPFIEADFDAITNYQLLCKVVEYLNKVIDENNRIGEQTENLTNSFTELQEYVTNYFDNLDIQEEINNKLDEMAESGQLTDIIAQYLNLAGVLAFDTIENLKNADNVVNGSICRTLGTNAYNDGYGNYYKIRNILNTDVIDNDNIIALTNFNNLIAEKIKNNYIEKMVNFEDNTNDSFETNYKFKNIDFRFDYAFNSIISIIKLKSISQLKLVATGENIENPENNIKSPFDYAQDNIYDLIINAGVSDRTNNKPVGICIFDGIGYVGVGTPLWYNGFDENGKLLSVSPLYMTTPEDLIEYGFKNCISSFKPVIYNGIVTDVSSETDGVYNNKHPRQLLLQDNNDDIYVMSIIGRQPYSQGMTYTEIATYLQNKNIKHCLNLDGGGSVQTVYNKKALFNTMDLEFSNGRPVSTAFVFNINGNLEV